MTLPSVYFRRRSTLVAATSFLLAISPAWAGTGAWTTSSWDGGFVPAANNILRTKAPANPASAANALTNPNNGNTIAEGSRSYATLTDGDAGVKDKTKVIAIPSNCSLSYDLGSARTINEVRIYSTWSDTGRDTLSVASVTAETQGGQTVTLSPNSVSHSGNNCCACATLKMADGSALCENAVKVTFNFGAQENGYVGYSELEVIVDGTVDLDLSGIIEIPSGENVTTNLTPADLSIWGPNGGNLTITGAGAVVTQNVADVTTMAGVNFGSYWPWIEGTVTVENGATLESDTQLFRGSGVVDNANKDRLRKLVVQSGASATFNPANGEFYAVGIENGGVQNAWVLVTGTGSALYLPANVYLGNKQDYGGHSGKMEVLDGGRVEGGTFYVGYHTGTMFLTVDGGSMKWTGGIYGFKNGSRWTGATILFKDCVVETPFYKMAYPHGNGSSSVTFNGAVFTPVGTPAAKFIDASPTGDTRCPHTVTGDGLIVDAPLGSTLEVGAMLQGAGGFTKRGEGTVTLSAANTYTGATVVEAGTLNITGAITGGLSVSNGAACAVSLASAPSLGAVSVAGTATFSTPFTATSLAIPAGGTLAVTGLGSNVGAVSDYAGDFVVSLPAGVSDWPQNTAIVSSSTDAFLEKVAAYLTANVAVSARFEFTVKEGSVQLVEAGLVNGTLTWTGATGDTLWSSAGNWGNAGRAIASGDTLVVAAGGASTNDLGTIVVESATFAAGIAAHTVSAAGNDDALKINSFVTNLSAAAQTFALPVSVGEAEFSIHAVGDVAFTNGLAAGSGVMPSVRKTGAGTLTVQGAAWGGSFSLDEGEALFTNVSAGTFASLATLVTNATTLRFSGPDTVVTQNVDSAAGYGNYWPWWNGVVTVEDGATLTSDTELLLGSGANYDNVSVAYRSLMRKLVVQSGATAAFTPSSGEAYIVGIQNGELQNAWVVVTGAGSTLTLPSTVYLGNKQDNAGHPGKMEVLAGGHVEGGLFRVGHATGALSLTVDGGSMKWTSGISCFQGSSRWTGATILFKDCVVETPFYKMAYPHQNGGSTVTFNGAVFKPVGTPAAKFIDASPTGDPKCPHTVTGGGLIIDAPEGATLNVPAKLQGDGGFVKLGLGTATLSATNSFTGATIVSNGTLRLTGTVAGPVTVASGATFSVGDPETVLSSFTLEKGGAIDVSAWVGGEEPITLFRVSGDVVLNETMNNGASALKVRNRNGVTVVCYGKTPGTTVILR